MPPECLLKVINLTCDRWLLNFMSVFQPFSNLKDAQGTQHQIMPDNSFPARRNSSQPTIFSLNAFDAALTCKNKCESQGCKVWLEKISDFVTIKWWWVTLKPASSFQSWSHHILIRKHCPVFPPAVPPKVEAFVHCKKEEPTNGY